MFDSNSPVAFQPDYIFIDSLSGANHRSKFQSTETEYANFLFDYKKISNEYNIGIIFIHHTLKNNPSTFSGTQKIMDNVDFLFEWGADNNDKQERYLKIKKDRVLDRTGQRINFKVIQNNNNWIFSISENNSTEKKNQSDIENQEPKSQNKMTQQEKILKIFRNSSEELTINEVVEKLEESEKKSFKAGNIRSSMNKLVEKGQLIHIKESKEERGKGHIYILNKNKNSEETSIDSSLIQDSASNFSLSESSKPPAIVSPAKLLHGSSELIRQVSPVKAPDRPII